MFAVTYHYIRPKDNNFPYLHAIDPISFLEQLRHFKSQYSIANIQDIFDKTRKKSVLLTFDDGFIDHYKIALMLSKMGIQGSFFPVIQAIQQKRVLDVHKIHFILAKISSRITKMGILQKLIVKNNLGSRYDVDSVRIVKNALQSGQPDDVRIQILDELFCKYVSHNEIAFAKKLYMGENEIIELYNLGMHIGSHGYKHKKLDHILDESIDESIDEIHLPINFLSKIKNNTQPWTIAYPHGMYNEMLFPILADYGYAVGFTTKAGEIDFDNMFCLPRYDTTHFSKEIKCLEQ